MELFIDSSDVEKIADLNRMLEIRGVTTNPSIIAKSGREPMELLRSISEILDVKQLLFAQVIQTSFDGIMEEAEKICSLRKNAYVKIPVSREGLHAIRECKKKGMKVLATAIFTATQAFLAAENGADYLAPYVNRMNNYMDGIKEVGDLLTMLRHSGLESKVVAASFKNVNQVHELMKLGVHAVTVPTDVAYGLISHPGTDAAVEEFGRVWKEAYGKECF